MKLKELNKLAQQVKEKDNNKSWKKAIEGIVWRWKKTPKLCDGMVTVVILEARLNSKSPEERAACDELYDQIKRHQEEGEK